MSSLYTMLIAVPLLTPTSSSAIKPVAGIMTRAANVLSANLSLVSTASVLRLVPGVILIVLMKNHLARGFFMGRVI